MKKRLEWADAAKRDIRGLDQQTAIRILHAIAKLLATGEGDIAQMQGFDPPEHRLRVGNYRVRFLNEADRVYINSVEHRKQAYRR